MSPLPYKSRLEKLVLTIGLIGMLAALAWATNRHYLQFDWTRGERNSLSDASLKVLRALPGPVVISAYVSRQPVLNERIARLVGRYQRHKANMSLRFVDPQTVPDEVRQLGITTDGELRIEHARRAENVSELTEQAMTSALVRVARAGERFIAFVTGHGERDLLGKANHDWGAFGSHLRERGYRLQPINLSEIEEVPRNTAVLVLADPRIDFLPAELERISRYLEAAGNLWWITDSGSRAGDRWLETRLGVTSRAGVIVDPATPLLSISDPSITVVTRYDSHPLIGDFDLTTLYPQAVALELAPRPGWESSRFLVSSERAWTRTSASDEARLDSGENEAGPRTIGVSLTPIPVAEGADAEQRVVVMGDADFVSNAYFGNGGNLHLGLSIISWLSEDDALIDIPPKVTPSPSFQLARGWAILIAFGGLFALPALLLATGMVLWWRRRRR